MKIALIEPYIFRLARGIERYVVSLVATLEERGHETTILTWSFPNQITWRELKPGVRIWKMPYIRYFAAYAAALYYFFRLLLNRYDMVMIFFACYGEAGALALINKIRRQKYSVVFHFPIEQVPHRYEEFKRYRLAEKADHLIAVSEFVAAGVRRKFGRDCDVIYNGVDSSVFNPSPELRRLKRIELGLGSSAPILVTLAALEERKGVQRVIDAFPLLLRDFPGLVYFVLGEGGFRKQLENRIERLSLEANVHLVGETNDVVRYLAAADVGCLLSYGEAMPLTLLEFMAMELPVVTSRHQPFPEFMCADWGEMVDEQDPKAVAATIGGLLVDGVRRQKMGRAGRLRVIDEFSWSAAAGKYVSLFETATAR